MTRPSTEHRPRDAARPHVGQWRLARVEVVNWGTFSGHHVVDIAAEGHLFTGRSGSGKSSLLDAIATTLTPPRWLRLNAAAQEQQSGAGDRTLVSYVRGAWRRETDDETGDAVSAYLRTEATWSGILLRYENGQDAPVHLVRLFHLRRGSNSRRDLSEAHLLLRNQTSLLDFDKHLRPGLNLRKLKAEYDGSDALVTDRHSTFAARFRRVLGISSENALQLLHRTQAAKSFGSLDQLFRNFMLDEPRTFELADNAVEQFDNLDQAHRRVIESRQQIERLALMSKPADRYDESSAQAAELSGLLDVLDDYHLRRMHTVLSSECVVLDEQAARLAGDLTAAQTELDDAMALDATARDALNAHGGGVFDRLSARLEQARERHDAVVAERDRIARSLREVGVPMPSSRPEYERLCADARDERRDLEAAAKRGNAEVDRLHDDRSRATAQIRSVDEQLTALRGRRSNINPRLLQARTLIADRAGIPESMLPFAGELIEIDPAYAEWTGATERVLRPLAATMLVRHDDLDSVSRVVDEQHLDTRLVYEVAGVGSRALPKAGSADSLLYRIDVTDGPFAPWLRARLADRFDYECVDSLERLRAATKAVTLAGQMKSGPGRFEKDDRSRIDDPSRWILGADSSAKVEALVEQRRTADEQLSAAREALGALAAQSRAAERRMAVLSTLDDRDWASIDVDGARAVIDARLAELNALAEGDERFANAQRLAQEAADRLHDARRHRADVEADLAIATRDLQSRREQLRQLPRPTEHAGRDAQYAALDLRYRKVQRLANRETLPDIRSQVTTALANERRAADKVAASSASEFDDLAHGFCRDYPSAVTDLTPSIRDRAGFRELHERIVSTGLPQHERRFAELLREQATQLTGHLLAEIRDAPGQIRARIDPVNVSLQRSRFDRDRYLEIRVADRRSAEVKDFIADLRTVSAGSWSEEDRTAAERRFAVLRGLMERLASGDSADRSWRSRCLDTRLHVSFTGIERSEDGEIVNVHDSSAGLSGGQRQKLVIFCLAAALRYQLTEGEEQLPRYGTVVLDEAFDKADSLYTEIAMDVFVEFGFHMILATPMKLLQTLEEYVGAVTHVTCRDFKASSVGTIAMREA